MNPIRLIWCVLYVCPIVSLFVFHITTILMIPANLRLKFIFLVDLDAYLILFYVVII